jgi:hypothetical protein
MVEDIEAIEDNAVTDKTRRQIYSGKREKEQDQSSWSFIRNPVGKLLLLIVSTNPSHFFRLAEMLHDLDNRIRLITLQAALRRDKVPPDQIADYMQHAGADLRNPYDDQPMHWDAASSTLSFEEWQENNSPPDDAPTTFSVHLKL